MERVYIIDKLRVGGYKRNAKQVVGYVLQNCSTSEKAMIKKADLVAKLKAGQYCIVNATIRNDWGILCVVDKTDVEAILVKVRDYLKKNCGWTLQDIVWSDSVGGVKLVWKLGSHVTYINNVLYKFSPEGSLPRIEYFFGTETKSSYFIPPHTVYGWVGVITRFAKLGVSP